MIQLQNISKSFHQTTAVDNISLDVQTGETLVLLGTSGCGKTTTLRMINRLEIPDSGEIFVHGRNIRQVSGETLRRGIGYVLQHHGLFPHYTVEENISIVPKLLKWEKAAIRKRVEELLIKLHLPGDIIHKFPANLSGGQQQRVGLARALAANPPLLLMDEPLGALDPVTRSSIRHEFKTLDELKQKTIIMVTHDVQEAFELGDRICLMNKGKIVQVGSPAELLFAPAKDFVNGFLNQQRLQLELGTIMLSDVWTYLPLGTAKVGQHTIDTNFSLWQLLEKFSAEDHNNFTARSATPGAELKTIDPAAIMQAYVYYKTTVRNG